MNFLVKKEYFELLNRLNHANKQMNMNTDVYFYIDRSDPNILKLFAAISKNQKIMLATNKLNKLWEAKYLTGSNNLEEYIAEILNLNTKESSENVNVTDLIKSHIFKLE